MSLWHSLITCMASQRLTFIRSLCVSRVHYGICKHLKRGTRASTWWQNKGRHRKHKNNMTGDCLYNVRHKVTFVGMMFIHVYVLSVRSRFCKWVMAHYFTLWQSSNWPKWTQRGCCCLLVCQKNVIASRHLTVTQLNIGALRDH